MVYGPGKPRAEVLVFWQRNQIIERICSLLTFKETNVPQLILRTHRQHTEAYTNRQKTQNQ